MRALKFRMWDNEKKVMYTPQKKENLWEMPDFKNGVFESNDRFKLMQFTGKCDCKGTPIYEDDIIEFWLTPSIEKYHLVKWDDQNSRFRFGEGSSSDIDLKTVVGNIWQNDSLFQIN